MRGRRRAVGRAVGAALLLAACYARPDTLGDPCREDDDCNDEQVCRGQICRPAPEDAPAPSGSGTDGGTSGVTGGGSDTMERAETGAEAAPHNPRDPGTRTRKLAGGSPPAALQR